MTTHRSVKRKEDADRLIAQYVDADPVEGGDDRATLRGRGIPIWALIAMFRETVSAEDTDDEAAAAAVADAYGIPGEAMAAAIAYTERYPTAIEHRIAINAAD